MWRQVEAVFLQCCEYLPDVPLVVLQVFGDQDIAKVGCDEQVEEGCKPSLMSGFIGGAQARGSKTYPQENKNKRKKAKNTSMKWYRPDEGRIEE